MITKRIAAALAALTLATTVGCSSQTASTSASGSAPATGTIKIGVSPVPHGEIITFVKDNLAKDAGLDLQVVEFNDYVQPNEALASKDLDANYFQHQPYLDEQKKARGFDFVSLTPVHLEPLGIYSQKAKKLEDLADGATVAIPNDPSNGGRALKLLAAKGLITLKDTGTNAPTVLDVDKNDRHLKFSELEAAQIPRSLGDVDAGVINGNYAIGAKLSPTKDALALEDAQNNPYANLLVVRAESKDDPKLKKLAELLCSAKTKEFIQKTYDAAVVPAC